MSTTNRKPLVLGNDGRPQQLQTSDVLLAPYRPGAIVSLGNFSAGGSIGSAATTVDLALPIIIAQTTASQTLTLPNPTVTTDGLEAVIINTGSASFLIGSTTVATSSVVVFIWGATAAAWLPVSSGGGSGTVTSVSVTTNNGVSGTVATATTTPAITITIDPTVGAQLGAILALSRGMALP